MPTIDLRGAITKRMNPKFRPLVSDQKYRIHVLNGGASSSKSYSTAQRIIYKCLMMPGYRWLVVRKVAKTLRHSVFDLLVGITKEWGVFDLFRANQTELTIQCPHGNQIIFTGLDDVEKLKSIYGITDIWVEEASEISEKDFNQLNLRLRGETNHTKQIVLTFNPIIVTSWIKKRFYDKKEDNVVLHHSTYKDNQFLDNETIKTLEGYTDPYFVDVYVKGKWGVYGNVVFTNFIIEDFQYEEFDLENVSNGVDFGFAHASAFIRVGEKDGELYVFDELYGKGWTNPQFISYIKEKWPDSPSWNIVMDSAEPARRAEFEIEGFRYVQGAEKGPGSLKYGIDYLCSKRLHVHATKCSNLAREVQSFKRREDKDGNSLDSFVEINDDAIAALRYACEWQWKGKQSMIYQSPSYTADDLGL